MKTSAWKHTAVNDGREFPYWELNRHPSVNSEVSNIIRCPYCGNDTDEFSGSEYWQLTFNDFKKAHVRPCRLMKRAGIAPPDEHLELSGHMQDHHSALHLCLTCGWWIAVDQAMVYAIKWQVWYIMLASSAVLQEFDLSNIELPITEARRYLLRKFEARQTLHPRKFEEIVASVFRDHGYEATATAYTRDGGIDVVMHGRENDRIGVQVKRHGRSIEVEQIRAFLGALTVGKYTRGIFVSSSSFQSGAKKLATQCCEQHIPIELIDAKLFFEMLGVAQLRNGVSPEECGFSKDKPPRFHLHTDVYLNSL